MYKGLSLCFACRWVNSSSPITVIYPYHTIIGHIYYYSFPIKTYVISSWIYMIGGGVEYYLILVSSQVLSILKMSMSRFD